MAFKDKVSKTFNQTFWNNYSKEANAVLSEETKKEENDNEKNIFSK